MHGAVSTVSQLVQREGAREEGRGRGEAPGGPTAPALTRQPPGHADDQQDDGTHQQDGEAGDAPGHPQGHVVCGRRTA